MTTNHCYYTTPDARCVEVRSVRGEYKCISLIPIANKADGRYFLGVMRDDDDCNLEDSHTRLAVHVYEVIYGHKPKYQYPPVTAFKGDPGPTIFTDEILDEV